MPSPRDKTSPTDTDEPDDKPSVFSSQGPSPSQMSTSSSPCDSRNSPTPTGVGTLVEQLPLEEAFQLLYGDDLDGQQQQPAEDSPTSPVCAHNQEESASRLVSSPLPIASSEGSAKQNITTEPSNSKATPPSHSAMKRSKLVQCSSEEAVAGPQIATAKSVFHTLPCSTTTRRQNNSPLDQPPSRLRARNPPHYIRSTSRPIPGAAYWCPKSNH
ncbi:hypothetical protein GCK32_021920 [Trichostrongylus colubriformis]|uniref:Uncharacterized protein n=1 Tax=Trichostrongylus colubriformis TaxID=6319 RepID=A0AAN8ESC0_TRICO